MRIRLALPDDIVGPATIAAALEASTVANEALARRGSLPDIERAIRDGHVVWKPEPFSDGEHFDLAPEVLRRGWGDCDDLAPWLAAQMRHEGENARAIAIRSGPTRYHALVEREDGQLVDPSRWAGMGRGTSKGVSGRIYGQLAGAGYNALALMPHSGGWGARADLALCDGDDQLASAAFDRDPKRALARAVAGLVACCEGIEGIDGDVGSFLSDVVSTVAPVAAAATGNPTGLLSSALPMAQSVLQAVSPGGGGGAAAPAGAGAPQGAVTRPIVSPAGSNHKGGGNLTYVPGGGPIIVRF